MNSEVIVIGAGPAGIGLASALLRSKYEDFLVLEAGANCGGLSGSFEFEGATFDYGGHTFTSKIAYVKDWIFNSVKMHEQKRKALCFFEGELIDYPFQDNFKQLSNPKVVSRCISEFPVDRTKGTPNNFEESMLISFGGGVYEYFIAPYNRKLWGIPLSELDNSWAGSRVVGVTERSLNATRVPLGSECQVAYPAKGGFEEIWRSLSRQVEDKIMFNSKVARIDVNQKEVVLASGESLHYKYLVSSIPLTHLSHLLHGADFNDLRRETQSLVNLPLKLIILVYNHQIATDVHRIYFSEERYPFHKLVLNNNSSPFLKMQAHHGIMFECSVTKGKDLGSESLVAQAIECSEALGFGKQANIISSRVIEVEYGYPVPTLHRAEVLARVRTELESYNISLLGRFAEWEYVNTDQVLAKALSLCEKIIEKVMNE